MKNICLLTMVSVFFFSCGTSPTINVRLRAADNDPQGNPFAAVLLGLQTGTSRGLYFQLYEMNTCPGSIQDVVNQGPLISQPGPAELGASPASDSFSIDVSSLDKKKAYFLKVVAVGIDNVQITHEGFADCPIYPSDSGKQQVILCFATKGITPQCSGTTDFSACRKPTTCQ